MNRHRMMSSSLKKMQSGVISRDKVHIEKLALQAIIGPDSWNRVTPQECNISLEMATDFEKASRSDELKYSLNYAVISKDISHFVNPRQNYKSLGLLAERVLHHIKDGYPGIQALALKAQAGDAHIRSDDVSVVVHAPASAQTPDQLVISNLKLLTLIGVFTFERLQKQYVTIDINMPWMRQPEGNVEYRDVIDSVVSFVESSNFKTVEALVDSVAQIVTQQDYFTNHPDAPVIVKVIKLNAITATRGVGVSCTRTKKDFLGKPVLEVNSSSAQLGNASFNLPVSRSAQTASSSSMNVAYLAFGSNVGDRTSNIQCAIDSLNAHKDLHVTKVSSIFESEPMYFQNQRLFLNGCIEVKTLLSPQELLKLCKKIEYEELKRVKEFDNGPRSIDLDIVLYKTEDGANVVLTTDGLIIPHPRLLERSFVLEPLCELISFSEVHPVTAEPIIEHLNQIYEQERDEDVLCKVIPLPRIGGKDRFLKFKNKPIRDSVTGRFSTQTISSTYTMGILNTTPDSFSDGGLLSDNLDMQVERIRVMVQEVLKLSEQVIIDIGGCSTRPNSEQASQQQELERTIPLIKKIRSDKTIPHEKVILSIDTYRAGIAKLAIEAGVDLVNDISGGQFDADMFAVLAEHPNVGYIMSHTRGDTSTMTKLTKYSDAEAEENTIEYVYGHEERGEDTVLVRNIGRELAQQYAKAVEVGIKRWQIVLDPGVGFAKHSMQNLEAIKGINVLKNYSLARDQHFIHFRNLPVLVGPSRKKFIGKITGDETAADRDFTTGTVAGACVGFGADIVRVHDTKNCVKSIRMADALYRQTL